MIKHALMLLLAAALPALGAGDPQPVPIPPETPARPAPLAPAEAARAMSLPKGFKVTVFAAEPDLVQPINMTFDDRGRLWVAQNLSYPNGALTGHDSILIFEDTDHDGHFDTKKVFYDKLGYLTSVLPVSDGVYVASAPYLYFFADRNHDDVPDGPPEVLLDGWTWEGKHNVINGLTFGPDGWLYGCHGITVSSFVHRPGDPPDKTTPINCGIWRYHPTKKVVEYVAEGSTNPWGLDFNELGEGFFSSSVTPHLFHMIPGAHYQRMHGHDFDPYVYAQIQTCADHLHWAGGDWTRSRAGTSANSAAGGGHAHCGEMIYYGDNWPAKYRREIFFNNIHGRRINHDTLARRGSGYVASHNPDFMFANDLWFCGVSLREGPDGAVYVSDWCDTGECHHYTDQQTGNGRIYRISWGDPKPATIDLAAMSPMQLAETVVRGSEWYSRRARRILQEHGADDAARTALRRMLADDPDTIHRLRAIWSLHVTGGLDAAMLLKLTGADDEHIRGWAVRLACEDRNPSDAFVSRMVEMARTDPSAYVRLQVASGLQRTPVEKRWAVAAALLAHDEDAGDANLPCMDWYAIEPLVPADPARATRMLTECRIPLVRQLIARRLTEMSLK